MESNDRAITRAIACRLARNVVRLVVATISRIRQSYLQAAEGTHADARSHDLIHNTHHGDDLLDTVLGNVLHETADNLEGPLSIGDSHDAVHPVGGTAFTRVVPSVLGTGEGVQVEHDTESVLSRPPDGLGKVCPRDFGEVRVLALRLHGPESERDTDPVQTSGGNVGKVLLGLVVRIVVGESHDKSLVVLLHLGRQVGSHAAVSSHIIGTHAWERVYSSTAFGVLFWYCSYRPGAMKAVCQYNYLSSLTLSNEPTAEVDTADVGLAPLPRLIQARSPSLRLTRSLECQCVQSETHAVGITRVDSPRAAKLVGIDKLVARVHSDFAAIAARRGIQNGRVTRSG